MVLGPFQPSAEELAQAAKFGIDHSRMTCSALRDRLTAARSKKRPERVLRDTTIARLQQLDEHVNHQQATPTLMEQLRNRLEYLLARNGVIEGSILVVSAEAPPGILPAGSYEVKSVESEPSGSMRVIITDDRELDAYEVLESLSKNVTVQ